MPPTPPNQKAGDLHEEYLARVNDGTRTRASGSQWFDQGDGHNHHDLPFAFFWDGKSTKGKQIAVTLDMIAKLREQSQGMRPQLGLRWYANENLSEVSEDWVAVQGADWEELLQAARKLAALEAEHGNLDRFLGERQLFLKVPENWTDEQAEEFSRGLQASLDEGLPAVSTDTAAQEIARWRSATEAAGGRIALLQRELAQARQRITWLEEDTGRAQELRDALTQGKVLPVPVPAFPWTVIYRVSLPGRTELAGTTYDEHGVMHSFDVGTVVVERHLGNRPRLIVNNILASRCDIYTDGLLQHRAWIENPDGEVG